MILGRISESHFTNGRATSEAVLELLQVVFDCTNEVLSYIGYKVRSDAQRKFKYSDDRFIVAKRRNVIVARVMKEATTPT